MQLILLTHSRETHKSSNTGQLISRVFANVKTIVWQRTEPDNGLLKLIEQGEIALIYPQENATDSTKLTQYKHFILIDSTWQEARKIFNRSTYLHGIPCVQFSTQQKSRYNLRRNQLKGGLCTAECAIDLFKACDLNEEADLLDKVFMSFVADSTLK